MSSLYDHAADVARYVYDRRIVGPPVLDLEANFPGAARFAGAWREIREEALGVAANLAGVPRFHEIMPEQAEISDNDHRDWRMFILKAYGAKVAGNIAQCPRLAALVAAAPDVLSASLSFLAPQTLASHDCEVRRRHPACFTLSNHCSMAANRKLLVCEGSSICPVCSR